MLSVVVPVYNVEQYLAECLDSVLDQSLRDLEVVLVDDGSTDGSSRIAKEYARRDPRVRLVKKKNGGLGAARNTGVRIAKGRYLTFVDSDDRLPPGALSVLVRSLRRTGSDIAVGAVERFNAGRVWAPEWITDLHAVDRSGVTLEDFPAILRNNYTWCKIFDRSFWDRCGLWFREGVAYEDQPIITQLLIRATAIDVLSTTVYDYRARDDRSSISQQTSSLRDLRDRASAWRASNEVLLHEASEDVYESWLQTLFTTHFHWYLNNASIEDPDYWQVVSDAVRALTSHAPERVWRRTSPEKRVALELARRGLYQELLEFRRAGGRRLEDFPTEIRSDGILVRLPAYGSHGLDDQLFVLRPEQLVLRCGLRRVVWDPDPRAAGRARRLRVSGFAYIPLVDLRTHDSTIRLELRDERTGECTALSVDPVDDPAIRPSGNAQFADYSRSTFEAYVDVDRLIPVDGSKTWTIQATVSAAGFEVAGLVTDVAKSGATAVLETAYHADGWQLNLDHAAKRPLRVTVRAMGNTVLEARLEGRRLVGRGVPQPAEPLTGVLVHVPGSNRTISGRVAGLSSGGTQEFELTIPRTASAARTSDENAASPLQSRWAVRGVKASGTAAPLAFPAVDSLSGITVDAGEVLAVERTRKGNLGAVTWRRLVLVRSASLTANGSLHVEGIAAGTPSELLLRVAGNDLASNAAAMVQDGANFSADIPLVAERGRFGTLPLPAATYWLEACGEGAAGTAVMVDRDLTRTMPFAVHGEHLQGRLTRTPWGRLQLVLLTPRGEDARGKAAQQGLHEWSVTLMPDGKDGLLVRSYFGESATDNGLGVLRELRRRGADLPVRWAVKDYSVPVPDGAEPVIHGSREWYRLLRSSRYYLDNMYQPIYHEKPSGQVMMQTFHGYPFKLMGHTYWEKAHFSRDLIESYDRRAAEWDYLVSPALYATPLLRREFRYDGAVLEIGYPRNDILLSPDSDAVRSACRQALGISDRQTVVLYAPTFRDELAKDNHQATYQDLLGLDLLARDLGEDFVVLLRGHAFHARSGSRGASMANVIDVTDYPEVSDLYLAADVAVVDYSSLRFDFAVTGKPMVFFVPDLQRYREMRGWLFDFAPTAPGPLLTTRAEVVSAIHDLDAIRLRYAPDYARFREEYLSLEDGRASERLVDEVFVPRGDAPKAEL